MASLKERNGKYCVIYWYTTKEGDRKQKWESFNTLAEAKKRKIEVEYKEQLGNLAIPQCTTVRELLEEYVSLYGKDKWALSTYQGNMSTINNYILPYLGDVELSDLTTRYMENYYQNLLKTTPVKNAMSGKARSKYVSTSTVRDAHKLLRSCFHQAVKWELMEKNPCVYATVPKHKGKKREIWTAETLMHALEVCEDDRLKLAINLSFACSLRFGELLGLTWDCIDISPEAIASGRASMFINKESQRVTKTALKTLNGKDVILIFPTDSKHTKSVRILKSPKTESSIRKVFIPKSVAEMLVDWKERQESLKETLGEEYIDFNLVMCTSFGMPVEDSTIRAALNRLIKEHNLPPVVFHSFRHSSVTYKLKLNGGDIKAVQGDSGHAQTSMVADVYSHIIDDDRRKNAELFEDAFYAKNNLNPSIVKPEEQKGEETAAVDPELLVKILGNPDMVALLTTLAKGMK